MGNAISDQANQQAQVIKQQMEQAARAQAQAQAQQAQIILNNSDKVTVVGTIPSSCPCGLQLLEGLCYKCPDGYTLTAPGKCSIERRLTNIRYDSGSPIDYSKY